MSEKLRELQHGLEVKGSGWLRSQAGKFRVDALRALATELGVSVEGISVKRDFVSLVCQKLEVQELVQRMKSVVRRGGMQLLQRELGALKVVELRGIATELGVSCGGLKEDLLSRLCNYFSSQDPGGEIKTKKNISVMVLRCEFSSVEWLFGQDAYYGLVGVHE